MIKNNEMLRTNGTRQSTALYKNKCYRIEKYSEHYLHKTYETQPRSPMRTAAGRRGVYLRKIAQTPGESSYSSSSRLCSSILTFGRCSRFVFYAQQMQCLHRTNGRKCAKVTLFFVYVNLHVDIYWSKYKPWRMLHFTTG